LGNRRIDHVGIVVKDLHAAKTFFLDLGFEPRGEGRVEGEWVERIIGLPDVEAEMEMLGSPEGEANVELIKFIHPRDERDIQPSSPNMLGIRHIAVTVDDIEAIVTTLKSKGAELVGRIQDYENFYRLCYVRGPEGIIVELAEEIE